MSQNQEANFEINLLPAISLLALLISFLLVTAVWLPLGGFEVKQAMGETATQEKPASEDKIQVHVLSESVIQVEVEQQGKTVRKVKIDQGDTMASFKATLNSLKQSYPEIKRVFLMPSSKVKYQNVIAVFSVLNELELTEIGLQPTL